MMNKFLNRENSDFILNAIINTLNKLSYNKYEIMAFMNKALAHSVNQPLDFSCLRNARRGHSKGQN